MHAALLIAGLATGLTLGRVFRVFVLVPTSLVAASLLVPASLQRGDTPIYALFGLVASLVMLQLGYMFGLLGAEFIPRLTWPLRRTFDQDSARTSADHSSVAGRR